MCADLVQFSYRIIVYIVYLKIALKKIIFSFILIFQVFCLNAQNLDLRLLEKFNGPPSGADATWKNISGSGLYVSAIVPIGLLTTGLATHDHDLTTKSLEACSSVLLAESFSLVIKQVTKRERPYLAHPDVIYGKTGATDYSFPSGHASVIFATATSLSLSYPKWYVIVPAYAYAATVGYSRMYLGAHYPSDVLGGALLGAGTAYLTCKMQKMFDKNYHKHQVVMPK